MPLALHPKMICSVVLPCDRDLPENERPVFLFRYMTEEQSTLLTEIDSLLSDEQTMREQMNIVFGRLAVTLIGWKNMKTAEGKVVTFDAGDPAGSLKKVLSPLEVRDMVQELVIAQTLGMEDKKKSLLQSPSDTEASAKSAAEQSGAGTGQQSSSQ